MDSILASAALLLGRPLADPVDLGGSDRSTVLRARTADGDCVVIKKYADTAEAAATFTAEASGLALTDFGPRLLAADPELPMIVMNDLGTHPTLADRLLGDQAEPAVAALREWAAAYGRLAATTAGRQDELARLAEKYSRTKRPQADTRWYSRSAATFLDQVTELGVAIPAGLQEELDGLTPLTATGTDNHPAFSPGDICPDNNLLTPDGFKVLDFESASFHSLFLDAAYARMPFATCWCVFRLPPGLAEEIEERYRAEVLGIYPDLADDLLWQPGVRSAVAVWTVYMSAYLMKKSKDADRPMGSESRPSPSLRQVLKYRWSSLLEELQATGELPALAQCLGDLLGATAHWQVEPLPLYPAFRG